MTRSRVFSQSGTFYLILVKVPTCDLTRVIEFI